MADDPTPPRPRRSDPEESQGPAEDYLEGDLDEMTGTFELELEIDLEDQGEDAETEGDGESEGAADAESDGAADAGDADDVGEFDETLRDGQVAYECTTWAGESRGLLASLLETSGIPHAWQGTTVTVREEDEARVDALVEDVLASARPALDPRAEKVVYEVAAWPATLQTSLADALTVADLPYEWDERGDLVVYAEHEEAVELIMEQLPDPDDPELDAGDLSSDDGLAVHGLLDQLFVGSERLARKPGDAAAIVRVDEATADLERMSAPFGFEPPQWRRLVAGAVELRDALEAGEDDEGAVDDEQLAALAATVRDLVRRYV